MVYDENISEDVSLSKILECFILEREEPQVIIDFLSQYKIEKLLEIFLYCTCSIRIFCLDFISSLNYSQHFKWFNIIKQLLQYGKNTCVFDSIMTMLLQIKYSNLEDDLKNKYFSLFQNEIKNPYTPNPYYVNPYVGFMGREIKMYDSVFEDINLTIEESFEKISKLPLDKFQTYISNISKSLWAFRMVQIDFFQRLPIDKQFVFIKLIYNNIRSIKNNPYILEFFLRQIFSKEIDIEIKKFVYNFLKNIEYVSLSTVKEEVKNLFAESESYEELMIKTNLLNLENNIEDIIFYALLNKKENFLKLMFNNDKELIQNNFNICDLIQTF